jgi:hypothetical protein
MLCCQLAVLQAPMFDGLVVDHLAAFVAGFGLPEAGIRRCDSVEALVEVPIA